MGLIIAIGLGVGLMIFFFMYMTSDSVISSIIIAIIIAIGIIIFLWVGNEHCINNTTTTTEVVQMEVVKLDLVKNDTHNGKYEELEYYISITNGTDSFIKAITQEEYVTYNIGDIVNVEVTTTSYDGRTKKTATIKGGI